MKLVQPIKIGLIWFPSLIISVFFVLNATEKMFYPAELDKVIKNSTILIGVGSILLLATILFLIDKTMIWGTMILALYMCCITFIHIAKGKPFEVAMLIVVSVVFAAYLRQPWLFNTNEDTRSGKK